MPKAPPIKPPPAVPTCTHEALTFEAKSNTYYIVCSKCASKWMAVDPITDTSRYGAIFQSYGNSPERVAPFYINPIPPRRPN